MRNAAQYGIARDLAQGPLGCFKNGKPSMEILTIGYDSFHAKKKKRNFMSDKTLKPKSKFKTDFRLNSETKKNCLTFDLFSGFWKFRRRSNTKENALENVHPVNS